jgi:hypothetical protein
MDYGDIIRLLVFGFIFLSFFTGLFGKKDGKKDAKQATPNRPQPKQKPVRPTEISQSGGQVPPRPVALPDPVVFDETGSFEVFTGEETQRSEALRQERRERLSGRIEEQKARERKSELLDRDITDMPSIAEDLDPERQVRRVPRPEVRREPRIVEGGDVLRHSLKDSATLERAFIVKEVLDAPLALRRDR